MYKSIAGTLRYQANWYSIPGTVCRFLSAAVSGSAGTGIVAWIHETGRQGVPGAWPRPAGTRRVLPDESRAGRWDRCTCTGKNTRTCYHEYRGGYIPDRKEKSAVPMPVQTGQKRAVPRRTDGLLTRVTDTYGKLVFSTPGLRVSAALSFVQMGSSKDPAEYHRGRPPLLFPTLPQ